MMPGMRWDREHGCWWVPVSPAMLPELGKWSEPVQVRIDDDQLVFRTYTPPPDPPQEDT